MSSTDTSTTNCAACGKEGGNLNTCNKCKTVKYCNAACKKKHRSKHKKACERKVGELHDQVLFREHPPTDDCPICFLPLPLDFSRMHFESCCGKTICSGCIYLMNGGKDLCAFCREPKPTFEEVVQRTKRLIEANNADAFHQLAYYYHDGDYGMPQDMTKANELWLRAGELGCAVAYFKLGNSYQYGEGVEVDKKKAKYYWEPAAMDGSVNARHNLGCMEFEGGNYHRAYKHFILAAQAGYKMSLDQVKQGFMNDIVMKDEYANTLRAYEQRHNEMKSKVRDRAEELRQAYLNSTTREVRAMQIDNELTERS